MVVQNTDLLLIQQGKTPYKVTAERLKAFCNEGINLPIATATTLGAIKVGANLSISADGTLSAFGGSGGGNTGGTGGVLALTGTTPVVITAVDPSRPDVSVAMAVPSIGGSGGSPGLISAAQLEKLNAMASGAQPGTVTKVAGTEPISVATGDTTPLISVATASTTAKGVVQLADAAAVTAGTTGLAVTADQLKATNDVMATKTTGGITLLTATSPLAIGGSSSTTRNVAILNASTTNKGVVQLADASAYVNGAPNRVVDTALLKSVLYPATEHDNGVSRYATEAEIQGAGGVGVVRSMYLRSQPRATEALPGIVLFATSKETATGTDSTKAVHPAGLKPIVDLKVNKSGDTLTGNLNVPSLNSGQLAGFRNALINGSLEINQRGVSIDSAAVGAYGPDRWKKEPAGYMSQVIEEGNYIPDIIYTLSAQSGYPFAQTRLQSPVSGDWTVQVPNSARFVQLEPGQYKTPFEYRSKAVELLRCLRYYCTFQGYAAGPTVQGVALGGIISYPIPMRVNPTVVLSGVSVVGNFDTSLPGIGSVSNFYQLSFTKTATATGSGIYSFNGIASAEF